MNHAFIINVYKDEPQALRLADILRRHYGDSGLFLHFSGDSYEENGILQTAALADDIRVVAHEPDKCRGIIGALNDLVGMATAAGAKAATLLHPDMAPTDRGQFRLFLRRFEESRAATTYAPIRPRGAHLSFCALTVRVRLPSVLFPVKLPPAGQGVCNEEWLTDQWQAKQPGWAKEAYPLALLNWPHSTCPEGGPNAKVMHGPGWQYKVHDYCPESSVVHTNDCAFWSRYDKIARF